MSVREFVYRLYFLWYVFVHSGMFKDIYSDNVLTDMSAEPVWLNEVCPEFSWCFGLIMPVLLTVVEEVLRSFT